MIRRNLLLILAIIGAIATVVTVFYDSQPAAVQRPQILPSHTPYAASVAGAGLIEASSRNIAIGVPLPGLIKTIAVKVGDSVKPGDVLFAIEDRDLQAQLRSATAAINEAAAALQKPQHQLSKAEHFKQHDPGAISAQELSNLRDEVAKVAAMLDVAKAQAEQVKVEIDRNSVRAPIAGKILQVNVRPGEYVMSGSTVTPSMLLGADTRLHVRVDIDENEAWRVQPGAAATAFVRSNPNSSIPLEYEYLEPYVIPKSALTGQSTERTDRRVLQVIYSFERGDLPLYIGQQLDVFIETLPVQPTPAGAAR